MNPLQQKVRDSIARHRMLAPGASVVVAVSGGPDSLCLLHVLAALRAELGVELRVAHLDHAIRGAESAAEAAFVAALAGEWGLPAYVETIDVPARVRAGGNLHAAAREARYAFLARVALEVRAQAVAVAHQADDQAETVMMHLLRGAGPEGLRGMRPVVPWEEWAPVKETSRQADKESDAASFYACLLVSPALVRPLLDISRAEVERYCAERGLEPRRDPTNLELNATRNRIRHDLMPRLIEYNPHIVAALGRTAAICADEQAFVGAALDERWPRLARDRAGAVDFDGAAWRELAPALQREALRRAHRRLAGSATLELEHVEQARALIERGVGRRAELPGGVALTVGYSGSFSLGAAPALDAPQLPFEAAALPAEGRLELAAGWWLEVTRGGEFAPSSNGLAIDLDGDALNEPLLARRRRPGDRIRPAGGTGSRRLQDLFVDAKVPRAARAAWPVVATASAVVWVPGLRAGEGFLAGPGSRHIVRIRLGKSPI